MNFISGDTTPISLLTVSLFAFEPPVKDALLSKQGALQNTRKKSEQVGPKRVVLLAFAFKIECQKFVVTLYTRLHKEELPAFSFGPLTVLVTGKAHCIVIHDSFAKRP